MDTKSYLECIVIAVIPYHWSSERDCRDFVKVSAVLLCFCNGKCKKIAKRTTKTMSTNVQVVRIPVTFGEFFMNFFNDCNDAIKLGASLSFDFAKEIAYIMCSPHPRS